MWVGGFAHTEGLNKRVSEVFPGLNNTDLKLYFFLEETMKHEKERRDNRHSRHIKTQQEDTARQVAQTESRGVGFAMGPHSGDVLGCF